MSSRIHPKRLQLENKKANITSSVRNTGSVRPFRLEVEVASIYCLAILSLQVNNFRATVEVELEIIMADTVLV